MYLRSYIFGTVELKIKLLSARLVSAHNPPTVVGYWQPHILLFYTVVDAVSKLET